MGLLGLKGPWLTGSALLSDFPFLVFEALPLSELLAEGYSFVGAWSWCKQQGRQRVIYLWLSSYGAHTLVEVKLLKVASLSCRGHRSRWLLPKTCDLTAEDWGAQAAMQHTLPLRGRVPLLKPGFSLAAAPFFLPAASSCCSSSACHSATHHPELGNPSAAARTRDSVEHVPAWLKTPYFDVIKPGTLPELYELAAAWCVQVRVGRTSRCSKIF